MACNCPESDAQCFRNIFPGKDSVFLETFDIAPYAHKIPPVSATVLSYDISSISAMTEPFPNPNGDLSGSLGMDRGDGVPGSYGGKWTGNPVPPVHMDNVGSM